MQLQASDRGTRGLGKLVEEGRPKWENSVTRKLATRSHTPMREGSRELKNTHIPRVAHCFMSGSLPTGRSGGDDPDGGVASRR